MFKLLLVSLLILMSACSSSDLKPYATEKHFELYGMATRQLPPDPVYNRLRWVYPPDTYPDSTEVPTSSSYIMPVFHMHVENSPLDETVKILAATLRYTSFCSSKVAAQRITINKLGTAEELAAEISRQANVNVIIDHQNKDIRFMPLAAQKGNNKVGAKRPEPRFYRSS